MAAPSAEPPADRPRPRPRPADAAPAEAGPVEIAPAASERGSSERRTSERRTSQRRASGRQLVRQSPPQGGQLVASAGSAVVAAAKVGRILGRSGWRLARQLPGVAVVEQQAQRLRQVATHELARLLETPGTQYGTTPEEQRAMRLARQSDADPLRTAMGELLDRSGRSTASRSRDYLFGSIVSQLVPDEARILAALAAHSFPVVDVVTKAGRGAGRTVVANVSPVARAAGVSLPQDGATYLSRLHGFGLIDFGSPAPGTDKHYESLEHDPVVQAARVGSHGSSRIVRKSVSLTALGREFWTACAPPTQAPRGAQ